jgi:RNA polymerase sigma factor (TIGR02999 family)
MTASGATSHGDPSAADHGAAKTPVPDEGSSQDAVFLSLYEELRALARLNLASERRHHTLQPTALVHDAWLRLVRAGASANCSPSQLLAAAARAMRHILIDHARARVRIKRGGTDARRLSLDAVDLATSGSFAGILAVDEAIRRLEQAYPKAAEVVRLRFYVGLSMEEVAKALGMSERSVFREWSYARAWLCKRLNGDPG